MSVLLVVGLGLFRRRRAAAAGGDPPAAAWSADFSVAGNSGAFGGYY